MKKLENRSKKIEGDLDVVENFKLSHPFENGIEVTYDEKFKNRNIVGQTYDELKNNIVYVRIK